MAGQIDYAAQYVEITARFIIEIDGLQFSCSEVSGLTLETDVVDYRAGDDVSDFKSKRAGLAKNAQVTMKKGIFANDMLMSDWKNEYLNDRNYNSVNNSRKEIIITQINENEEEILQVTLVRAWPSKWEGPSLNSTESAAAFESMTWECDQILMETL